MVEAIIRVKKAWDILTSYMISPRDLGTNGDTLRQEWMRKRGEASPGSYGGAG